LKSSRQILIIFVVLILLVGCNFDTMTANNTSPPLYENIPGVYLGTFHGTKSSSVDLFRKIGKGVAISSAYLDWSSGFNNGFLIANANLGRISFLTWEFMPGSSQKLQGYKGRVLEAIVDGLFDEYLTSWAGGMRRFGKPAFLRFGHEMNGDWYPWAGVNNGAGILDGYGSPDLPDGPERFVDAYRYIHDHFLKAGADNVLWVWCLNAPFEVMERSLGLWNSAAAYYPGDDYVDWMCFDGYNWGNSAFGQQFNAKWNSFDEIFASSYLELQAINPEKPIIIGEFASTEEGGSKASWISDTFSSIRLKFPQIRALIWFHIAKETDWRINSSESALNAYREAIADDYWLSEWPGMIP
jgi:hypothetical protein